MRKFRLIFLFLPSILVLQGQNILIQKYNTVNADSVRIKTDGNHKQITNRTALLPGFTSFANGNVLLVWSIYGGETPDSLIYYVAQQLDKEGKKVGPVLFLDSIKMDNGQGKHDFYRPSVAKINENSFAYSFQTYENVEKNIYRPAIYYRHQWYRKYDLRGKPISNKIRFDTSNTDQRNPSLIADENGKLLIGWKEYLQYEYGWPTSSIIKFRFFDKKNKPTKCVVADTTMLFYTAGYSICLKNDLIAIVWQKYKQDDKSEQIYFRLFNSSGKPMSDPMLVNPEEKELFEKEPKILIHNDQIFICWIADNRNDNLSIQEELTDSCCIDLAVFNIKGERIEIKTIYKEPIRMGVYYLSFSEYNNNLLCTWTSFNEKFNEQRIIYMKGALINADDLKGQNLNLLFNGDSPEHFYQDFRYSVASLTETGDIFVTWYGEGTSARIPGDVYYARTSVK
jgi:hypothetical protein